MIPHRLVPLLLFGSLALSAHAETSATVIPMPATVATLTPEQQTAVRELSRQEIDTATPRLTEQVGKQVEKQIEGEKQAMAIAKDALEVGRKSVDWWLSNLSFWIAVLGLLIAVAGIGIPLWMGRKQKAEWQEKLNLLTQKLQAAETARQQAEAAKNQAKQHAEEIETLLKESRNRTSLIPNAETFAKQHKSEIIKELQEKTSSEKAVLINRALNASKNNEWKNAYWLWKLLSYSESLDANLWYNWGKASLNTEPVKDLDTAIRCFRNAYLLDENHIQALSALAFSLGCRAEETSRPHALYEESCEIMNLIFLKDPASIDIKYWKETLSRWSTQLDGEWRLAKLLEKTRKEHETTTLNESNNTKDPISNLFKEPTPLERYKINRQSYAIAESAYKVALEAISHNAIA
ncbi:hypothetical protein LH460_13610 [Laribacter hongkongensis]|uniref:hypothetical protein n=1 Tax=Laribacter hongkongensis TaxID=168471 RepID=UPI001EFD5B36|nr:hypothetical protein [Laribacter hongkongensis]MCG9125672.1 hypothetical protein [Laribacter hongkongensis]